MDESAFKQYEKYDTYKILINSKELSEYDKNAFMIKMFSNTFTYLETIDVIQPYIIDFLNSKYKVNINSIIDTIDKYINLVYNYFIDNKEINLINKNYILFIIYKYILLLYSYYYYNVKSNKEVPYNDIIRSFRLLFNVSLLDNINLSKIVYINTEDFKKYFKVKNKIIDNIVKYIDILKVIDELPNNYSNEYITIPQYLGNCWYISVITGFCFSDLSKNLILSKIDTDIKKKELLSKSSISDKIFIETIDYIIKSISKDYKKYGDNIYSNCNDLIYLKEHIMDYLFFKYSELKSTLDGRIDSFKGSNNYWYKSLNDKINYGYNKAKRKEIDKIKLLDSEIIKKYSIRIGADLTYGFTLINSLYNIFNISTMYLWDYIKSNNYKKYNDNISINSPDIIIIHLNENDVSGNFIDISKNTINNIDKETIEYNGYKYKLDYILHSTDTKNTCKECGHCISAIHYNNNQYYHNSGYLEFMVKCGDKFVEIPCSLISQKWVDDIDKASKFINDKKYDDNDICLFNIQQCFYKNTDTNIQNLHKNIISENNMCFNNLHNLIKVYIKINEPIRPPSPILNMEDDVSPPKPKPKIKPKINICDKWLSNKLINPETLRKIKENGPTYKKLVKLCLKISKPIRPISPILNMEDDISPPKIKRKSNKASKIIKSLFLPYIKRQSIDIIDRIRYYIIIRRYLTSIKDKENCFNLYNYDDKTKQSFYRIGNRIILDKRIGTESAVGIVYIAHIKSNTNYGTKFDKLNKFAVKITNQEKENKIELEVLEKLTKLVRMQICPHFPINYGYLECSNTNIDKKNKGLYPDFFKKNKKIFISLNELANGDLHDLLILSNKPNFYNIFAQIFIALMFFHTYIDSFHNDPHTGNFLYHKIEPGGYLHYNIYGKDYYLENQGYLWVIWDFGLITPFRQILDKNYSPLNKNINYDYNYVLKTLDWYNYKLPSDEVSFKKIFKQSIIKNYDKIYDIKLLKLLNIEILSFFIDNIPSFTTIKPSNIINKTPYIIE